MYILATILACTPSQAEHSFHVAPKAHDFQPHLLFPLGRDRCEPFPQLQKGATVKTMTPVRDEEARALKLVHGAYRGFGGSQDAGSMASSPDRVDEVRDRRVGGDCGRGGTDGRRLGWVRK